MKEMENYFDTSNYLEDNPLFSNANKKVIGKFKDECKGIPPIEFVGLRSKMYSLQTSQQSSKQKMKGVPKCAGEHHDNYKTCLKEKQTFNATFKRIHSHNHVIKTIEVTKKSLSAFDDKRWLLEDGVNSVPYH